MTISLLECLFLVGFLVVFMILGLMEIQIHQIKVMMEEHIKYDEPLSNGCPHPHSEKKDR